MARSVAKQNRATCELILMKIIPLTKGKSTTVSDCDYDWLMQWSWQAAHYRRKSGDLWYAVRTAWSGSRSKGTRRSKGLKMHREIAMRAGKVSKLYDHKDGNGLNNQRENIRPCTHSQNSANSKKTPCRLSRLKGVNQRESGRWKAQIGFDGKHYNLGTYDTEELAHKAYMLAARRHWGEFARP